ncbi:MAG: hypothetical protein KDD73_00500 [Anaerolineales bacterium]|nr:hypothetical protein [Anaerolineales bacterium]MCB9128390.1 hypothetical protein [Ardenticatenales bacterium]
MANDTTPERPEVTTVDARLVAERVYELLQEELAREAARRGNCHRNRS